MTFTTPSENDLVVQYQKVQGTVFNVSPDQHLWLVIQSKYQKFYPQEGPIHPDASGEFSVNSYFGDPGTSSGEPFHLMAVVVPREGNDIFVNYLEAGTRNSPGLEKLPDGFQVVSENIVVTRR